MQAFKTATGCTQDTNIQHLLYETLILPIYEHMQLHASQFKHKHTIYFTTPRLKSLQSPPQNKHSHTVTTTDIKTNMCHLHTSIVSRHLAVRSNNKILHTPPPYIRSSEDTLSRLTRRTPAQIRINKSPFLKSYYATFVTLTHTSSPQIHPHTYHVVTHGFIDRSRRSDGTAGQMDGEAGWLTTTGNIGLPPPTNKG